MTELMKRLYKKWDLQGAFRYVCNGIIKLPKQEAHTHCNNETYNHGR